MEYLSNLLSLKLWFLKIIGLFLIWVEPARQITGLLIFLIVVDAITTIWLKIDRNERINLKEFLIKQIKDVTLFLLYILTIHYFQVAYLGETMGVFKILAGIPIIALLSGIVENIESLTGLSVATKFKEIVTGIFGKLNDKVNPPNDQA
ncbi:hypothetical protein [Pedobacter sp.]|uniref:hypothetical protein n=1 Tax=Pedobacter sp. TaxID=1411316 RepID=UPI003D7F24C4